MKIPVFAGNTLADFLKSAKLVRTDVRDDGSEVDVYGTEVVAPSFCAQQDCDADEPLRCCGSYPRQVIEGVLMVLLLIYRFRCRSCGKTASCPYSFLVPYRRFTAKWICWGIELYGAGQEQTTYDEVSVDLSTTGFVDENENTEYSAQEELEEKQKKRMGRSERMATVLQGVRFSVGLILSASELSCWYSKRKRSLCCETLTLPTCLVRINFSTTMPARQAESDTNTSKTSRDN